MPSSVENKTSTAVEDDRSPAATPEPAVDVKPATSEAEPVDQGAPAGKPTADQAFEQFQSQEPDNSTHDDPPPSPGKAEGDSPDGKPAEETPAAPPAGDQPAADPEKDLEPTAAQLKDGRVPVKQLTRALASRGKIRDERDAIKAEKIKTESALNAVLDIVGDTELEPHEFKALAKQIAPARKGDATARQAVLGLLGIELPAPAAAPAPDYTPEEIREALRLAAQDVDPDSGVRFLDALKRTRAPAAPAAAPAPVAPAAPAAPARPVQPQAPAVDVEQAKLQKELTGLASALTTAYPVAEVRGKIAARIDQTANSRVAELQEMGVQITPSVLAGVYRKAQSTVLASLAKPTDPPRPATVVRPSANPAPPKKLTADERFEQFQRG